jgi:hypothetical protein
MMAITIKPFKGKGQCEMVSVHGSARLIAVRCPMPAAFLANDGTAKVLICRECAEGATCSPAPK